MLQGLFEGLSCLSDVVGRQDEKQEILSALMSTVGSVSQSVKTVTDGLTIQEKNRIFNSNQVFPELVKVLQECSQVIAKHKGKENEKMDSIQDVNGCSNLTGVIKTCWNQSSRTVQEGLEVLGSKFGSLGNGILPEDELAVLQKADADLQRLLPQLQLAIQAHVMQGLQGLKRSATGDLDTPDATRRRLAVSDGNGHKGETAEDTSPDAKQEVAAEAPLLVLQLVSDEPSLASPKLSELSTKELRPASTTSVSTTSLESNPADGEEDGSTKLVFGRQEIRSEDKVPKSLWMPQKPNGTPEPLWKFVSREFLLLDIPPVLPQTQDSVDMPTLVFGGESQDDFAISNGHLATVSGLSATGIHFRKALETQWRWLPRGQSVELHEGDRVAALMFSTGCQKGGIQTPAPQRDLPAEEVTCLLGIELRRP